MGIDTEGTSMKSKYDHLLSPIKLAGVTFKNRMFSAPTSLAQLGPGELFTKENIEHYKLRAMGGAAVVTVGEVMVDLESGRSHREQLGINNPQASTSLIALCDAIHGGGAMASVELDHGGALCPPEFIGGKHALGPSSYIDPWGDQVDEMTDEQICAAAEAFGEAAQKAKAFGYDMVTLHMGHGWLIHQFISPLTNKREDCWGGSIGNRLRFPLLVLGKVRAAVGREFPIECRISGSELTEGGYGIETGVEIAKALDGKADLIHVSAGTQQVPFSAVLMHPGIFQKDMANSGFAAEIKKHVKTPVLTVGAFNLPEDMERVIAEGEADCIGLARALIADPFLPAKTAAGRAEDITPCLRCGECLSGLIASSLLRCSVNPVIGREWDAFHPTPVYNRKRILIAGGGPGGMQAALSAVERGHEVTLVEAKPALGGALGFADSEAAFYVPMRRYRDSQIAKVLRSGADVRLGVTADAAMIEELAPDVIIAATGGEAVALNVSGAELDVVYMAADVTTRTPPGKRLVVVGGGLIGCESAVRFAGEGREVVIIETRLELASECGRMHRLGLMHEIETSKNITVAAGMQCSGITRDGVSAVDCGGKAYFFECDSVIVAVGVCANDGERDRLRGLAPEFYAIGDANRARKIMAAVREGYDAVAALGMIASAPMPFAQAVSNR